MSQAPAGRPRVGLLFTFDWDAQGFAALADRADFDQAGFDLFSFPSNAHLIHFDLLRFAERQARRGRQRGWAGVVSHHEQFGALAAALVAERLGLPGTSQSPSWPRSTSCTRGRFCSRWHPKPTWASSRCRQCTVARYLMTCATPASSSP